MDLGRRGPNRDTDPWGMNLSMASCSGYPDLSRVSCFHSTFLPDLGTNPRQYTQRRDGSCRCSLACFGVHPRALVHFFLATTVLEFVLIRDPFRRPSLVTILTYSVYVYAWISSSEVNANRASVWFSNRSSHHLIFHPHRSLQLPIHS